MIRIANNTRKAFQRRPMTLCGPMLAKVKDFLPSKADTYHFQRPDPPYPYLELALDASNVLKLHSLPPAATSWFPPEKEQLLRHAYSIAVSVFVALDVRPQARKSDTADDSFVGFTGTVAPSIIVVETTTSH